MNWAYDIILLFGIFLVLLLSGLWIPLAIGITALIYMYITGSWSSFNALGIISWGSTNSFTLTAIPLFILMADLLLRSGLSTRLYHGLSRIVRRLPGGLLQTNIAGCGLFSAISGSSVATAAAIGTVALPELEARNYDPKLSAGTLAAGGTLGILIPPSIAMIIYGTFTEDSIAKLFMAGLLPGVILMLLLMVSVGIWAMVNPRIAPREKQPLKATEIFTTVFDLLPFAAMIGLVLGTIYLGLVTPTEAAAVGCCLAVILSLIWGNLNLLVFRQAVQNTIRTSGAIMFIILAANLFSYAVGASGISHNMTNWLVGLNLGRMAFLITMFVLYSIMGCLVDSIGMMVITVPLLQPVLVGYGIDTIWFGVVLVLLIELGQITPPLGINLFVIQGIRTSGRLEEVILGTVPFYAIIFLMIGLLVLVPDLALWLPSKMTLR